MKNKSKNLKKSLFVSKQIRELSNQEKIFLQDLKDVVDLKIDSCIICYLSESVSFDIKIRPLILSKEIVIKITNKHGSIPIKNLLINAHNWDYVIRNVDGIRDKINIIKKIPNSDNFLLIGAIRENGFFILTHFETVVLQGNELKSLLGRGDLI